MAEPLVHWNRLVRYVSAKDGIIRFGEPILASDDADIDQLASEGSLRVKVFEGATPLTARPSPHAEEEQVGTLLGPLAPEHVPILRCVGLNYRTHILETGLELPQNPTLFIKARHAIANTRKPVVVPKIAQKTCDYEGELTVLIGRDAKNVSPSNALSYVAAYTVGNDVSCRDWQIEKEKAGVMPQWCFSKSFDNYAPLGPALVSSNLLGDAGGLRLQTFVNGELRQDTNTSDLLFGVRQLVSFLSTGTTLEAGSLIMTGTPGGIAGAMKPHPKWLKNGDEVVVVVDRIGSVRNVIQFE